MSIRNDMTDTSGVFLNSAKFRGKQRQLFADVLQNKCSQNSLKKRKSQSLLNKAASFPPGTGGLDTTGGLETGVFLRIW